MAKHKKHKKKSVPDLLNPSANLRGKHILRIARALTRIETQPQINAYRRLAGRYGRDMNRDLRGLHRLGERTRRQIGGAYSSTDVQLAAAKRATRQRGVNTKQQVSQIGADAGQRLNEVQTSTLGNQIDTLAGQGIPAGQSASQSALAQAMASQQQSSDRSRTAWDQFTANQASTDNTLAANMLSANKMARVNAKAEASRITMSRKAQTRADYGEARRDVLGKLADAKSLKGSTMLKNLLELREGERSFLNEKAAVAAQMAQANMDNQLDWAKLTETERHNRQTEKGGSGGGSGKDGAAGWSDFLAAANLVRGKGKVRPNSDFWEAVFKDDSLDDTGARQRLKWRNRYQKWLRNHNLLG